MKKFSNYKKRSFATLLLCVYAFVVVFAGFLHQHKSISFDGNHHKELTDNSKISNLNVGDDCLACHLHFTQKSLLPHYFSFNFEKYNLQEVLFSVDFLNFTFEKFPYFSLRAPPVFI